MDNPVSKLYRDYKRLHILDVPVNPLHIVGEGRALHRALVDADLEGIVATRLGDPYDPQRTRWHKILNRDCS